MVFASASAVGIALAVMLGVHPAAAATFNKTGTNSTEWRSAAAWVEAGFPVSGDDIQWINNTNANRILQINNGFGGGTFGDTTVQSNWGQGANGRQLIFDIASGNTLTHVTGSTLVIDLDQTNGNATQDAQRRRLFFRQFGASNSGAVVNNGTVNVISPTNRVQVEDEVAFTNNGTWNGRATTLVINSATFLNSSGALFTHNGGNFQLQDDAVGINSGEIDLLTSQNARLTVAGDATFTNTSTGDIDITARDGRIFVTGTADFVNDASGSIDLTSRDARIELASSGTFTSNGMLTMTTPASWNQRINVNDTSKFEIAGGTFTMTPADGRVIQILGEFNNANQILNSGGTINVAGNDRIDLRSGTLGLNGSTTLNVATLDSFFNGTIDGGELRMAGNFDSIDISTTDGGSVGTSGSGFSSIVLGSTWGPTTSGALATTVVSASSDLDWVAGFANTRGGTITNNGTLNHGGGNFGASGGQGNFVNNGTLNMAGNLWIASNDLVFNNNGLIEIAGNGADHIEFRNHRNELINASTGIIRSNSTGGENVIRRDLNGGTGGNQQIFRNLGTIEVLQNNLRIAGNNQYRFESVSTSTLIEGTYRVLSDSLTSRLDIDRGNDPLNNAPPTSGDADQTNFDGSIVSILGPATLVLSGTGAGAGPGAGAELPQLGEISTLEGGLFVHKSVVLPVDSALVNEGVLGGDGTIDMQGGTLTNEGTIAPSGLDGSNNPSLYGVLNIDGSLDLGGPGSVVQLDIGGTLPGTNLDQLLVDGGVTLGGDLELDFIAGLPSGSVIDLIIADNGASISGTFDDISFTGNPISPPGEFVVLTQIVTSGDQDIFQLSVFATTPEPASGALLAIGVIGFVLPRRRKK